MESTTPLLVLTGATGAIGRELADRIAAAGYPLVLGCRNSQKAAELASQLADRYPKADIRFLPLDLQSEASIRNFADALAKENKPLVLINNAGVMRRHYGCDAQGRELTMLVNYTHTRLLTELLIATGRLRRVVFTTSLTRFFRRPFQSVPPQRESNFHQLRTYGLSKRLLTDYAARLHKAGKVEVACADPGIVDTGMIHMERWYDKLADLCFRPFIRTPGQGSLPAWRALHSDPGYIYCARRRHRLPTP